MTSAGSGNFATTFGAKSAAAGNIYRLHPAAYHRACLCRSQSASNAATRLKERWTRVSDSTAIWDKTRPAFDLFQGFALSNVIAGLEMSGNLSLVADGGITHESIEQRDTVEAELLTASLRYLSYRGVVREDEGRFSLTDYGTAIYRDRGFLVWLVGGYGDPLRRLDAFLGLGKRYGVDFTRDGRWVADGTTMMARENIIPDAMRLLDRISFDRVLDLGCGNARFLTSVCDRFDAMGIGVDVSPAAYAEAEKAIVDAGMRERVQTVLGDVRDLDDIPDLDDVDLAVTFFLLHEILATGRNTLVRYLADLSERLSPGANLVIGEIEPPYKNEDGQRFTPEFTYVHALMRQRLAVAEEWGEILTESGFVVREVVRCRIPGGILLHCENRPADRR
jgi:SAM-dependent methyltransferase